ncbi:MAG TPA: sugar porter family MFS transporter [Verrucomicrobiota bacterium]|nr:sugar porter family MFS transporter [Verrucomicrobiota bacterium]HNU51688.1 sugar porter family MFS transporter [Verrucomicrobiota bacterium]
MKARIVFWSITSALAGFLFGFDTVVISGAEQKIQSLWNLSPGLHGMAMAAALYGTVIGSLLGGVPSDKLGRKPTLTCIGLLYILSAVGCGFAWDVTSFVIARFLGGLGIGISTVAAPLYIAEISPPAYRGRLAGMFQFNIVFGILVAFVSNAALAGSGENAWRWMLGVAAFPSVLYTVMCLGLPESPRWLIGRKGDRAAGLSVLRLIEPGAAPAQLEAHADEILAASSAHAVASRFWTWRLRLPILLAFLIAFFNQLSGINAILYFAPRIFGLTGSENPFAQSVGIGFTNLAFTWVGLWLIDRLGRRTLLFIGSFGYILSLGLCAVAFFTWAPQFRAASAAVDVKSAVDSLQSANPARVAKLTEELAAKKQALVAATAVAASGAKPVGFAADARMEAVKAAADTALHQASRAAGSGGLMVLVCIFAFIAAHAVGQGAVIWVFISEIFPNRHRAEGQALGSATHWVFAALLTTFFPLMMTAMAPGYVFCLFCGMMMLQLVWVKFMMPETKGVPLEHMQKRLGIE